MSVPAAKVSSTVPATTSTELKPTSAIMDFMRRNASWSWLSIPSLLLVWILVATQFESYILPQPWEVIDEAWNEMLFPTQDQYMDDDGNIKLSGLSLRPENTASVVRSYIQKGMEILSKFPKRNESPPGVLSNRAK